MKITDKIHITVYSVPSLAQRNPHALVLMNFELN